MTPDTLPTLNAAHLAVLPIRAQCSFIVRVQIDSPADKAITEWLTAQAQGKSAPPPKITPSSVNAPFPRLPATGTGIIDLADTAYLLLVKLGNETHSAPNETELEIGKFITLHGRKTPRPK